MQGLSGEEFHDAFQQTVPSGETWFDDRPDLLLAFEADFRRAIATSTASCATTSRGWARGTSTWPRSPCRSGSCTGTADRMVPAAHGEWLHERLPNSERHVVPGGHGRTTFGGAMDAFAEVAALRRRGGSS